jgi:hypothetical protein
MNKPVVIASLLLVAATAFQLVERRRQGAEVDRLQAKMASLTEAQEAAQRRAAAEGAARKRPMVAAAPAVAAPVTAAPDQEAAAAQPAGKESARRPLEVGEVRDRFEDRFAHERPDAAWSGNAQTAVQAKLAPKLPATSELTSVECRASLCRVETVHASLATYRQFLDASFVVPDGQPWKGSVFSTPLGERPDGRTAFVTYLMREPEEPPTASTLQ